MYDLGNSTHAFLHSFILEHPKLKNEEIMRLFYSYRYSKQMLEQMNKELLRLEIEVATMTSAIDKLAKQKEIDELKEFINNSPLFKLIENKRNKIINHNLKLVLSVANKYSNLGLPVDDLFQAGILGFINGIDKFDPNVGSKLTSYCTWWIRQRITREISNTARIVRIPVPVSTDITKLLGTLRANKYDINSRSDLQSAAEKLNLSYPRVLELRRLIRNFYPLNQVMDIEHAEEQDGWEDTLTVLLGNQTYKNYLSEDNVLSEFAIDLAYFMKPLDDILKESDPIMKYIVCKKFGLNVWDSHFYSVIDSDIYRLIQTSSLEDIPIVNSRRVIQYFSTRALFELIDDPNKPDLK